MLDDAAAYGQLVATPMKMTGTTTMKMNGTTTMVTIGTQQAINDEEDYFWAWYPDSYKTIVNHVNFDSYDNG